MTNLSALTAALRHAHRMDETEALSRLLPDARLSDDERHAAEQQARHWIETVRAQSSKVGGVSDFLQEFRLSSEEGIALMCVAEALLRVPDAATADDFIRDKLGNLDWDAHEKRTGTLFANASVWGLMLTGAVLKAHEKTGLLGTVKSLMTRLGQPVIRAAMTRAIGLLGDQFVLGKTIHQAIDRSKDSIQRGYRFSYDMLGEGARTFEDAERYFAAYEKAIVALDKAMMEKGDVWKACGLSVKLSALYPRFSEAQRAHCVPALVEKLVRLAEFAARAGIPLTVDAEETERLDLTLDIMTALLQHDVTKNWQGLGLAVQAYQKRAPTVIDYLAEVCRHNNRRMMVRLVKGAYWDSEIKRSQMGGFSAYPVYTRKVNTDVSYMACARKLLALEDVIYPAFGSHNAFTLSAILAMAKPHQRFEVQRLQGMGRELHDQIVAQNVQSRIYAPVGGHQDLLAYLVRRILENGANSSFVHRVKDDAVPIAALVHDPAVELADLTYKPNPSIPLPPDLFGAERRNSSGVDLDARDVYEPLFAALHATPTEWQSAPLIGGVIHKEGDAQSRTAPADPSRLIGRMWEATDAHLDKALTLATQAQRAWGNRSALDRAAILDKAADGFEENRVELIALLAHEAGRVVKNAVAEVREAVDLCRYYAAAARRDLAVPERLHGYTGEHNTVRFAARGVIAAISPWNFPLAIFVGQIAAALLAGNAVIAKPAEQTPLIAFKAVQILHAAGVPPDSLALLTGKGETIGAALVQDARVKGVVFTGSTEVGRIINRTLANRAGAIVPLIAETGGLNAMIVDSTALPEQVVDDVMVSAFDSAGQRCSSLRVLFVQEDIADKVSAMLMGAMKTLRLGHPLAVDTDISTLIDDEAKQQLAAHVVRMQSEGKRLYAVPLPAVCERGSYFPPHLFELDSMTTLKREAFGPVLHLIRWQANKLDAVVQAIEQSGYGLTCGIHSRRSGFIEQLEARLPVGNLYVNRNMIGAVPGVHPFGGEGLSGTGPKAGGDHYLRRFCVERSFSQDTTAAGGNASLLMMG